MFVCELFHFGIDIDRSLASFEHSAAGNLGTMRLSWVDYSDWILVGGIKGRKYE